MKFLMILLAVGLTTADKLDRTYLPPPGSQYSGGQSGDLQVPLEYSNGFSTTGRPQGSSGFPSSTLRPSSPNYQVSFPSSTQAPNTFQTGIPTTTTSYAFTQTTTFSPTEDQNSPVVNQGQVLVDQNGNPIRPDFFQPAVPQQVGIISGNLTQRPGMNYQPGVVRYDQNGNVIPQTVYDKDGNIVPQVVYDRNGNIVPQTVYDKNGNILPQVTYDQNGNILPKIVYDRNGNIVPQTIYDKNGNVVPQVFYDRNGNVVPQVIYDQNGNIIPQTVYDKNGNVVPQISYDRNGNVAPNVIYNQNGKIVPQTAYDKYGNVIPNITYDRFGNIVPQVIYDKNGKVVPQTVYDKNGNIIPQVTYDRNGNVVPKVVYDGNGNIIPQVAYDKNGNVVPQTVYDKNQNIIPQVTYDRNGNVVPKVVYDSKGNIIPQVSYDINGNIVPQTVYGKNENTIPQVTYDRNGNIVPEVAYDGKGNIIPQVVYDKSGNIIPQTVYDKNGNIIPQVTYERKGNVVPKVSFDSKGNIIPQVVYDKNGNVVPQIVYDKNGNIIPQVTYDRNGNVVPQVAYDGNGNIVPQIIYNKDGNVVPQLTYDRNGNVVPNKVYDRNGNVVLQPSKYGLNVPIVRPERPQAESDRNAVILDYKNVLTPEGYAYSYDTSNGIHADENGTAVDGVKAQGGYSYIGDDGKTYSVVYSADENGFLPRGDHLPTPPPIPEAILRVIEDAKRAKEAGIIEDGSYDDNKYGYKKYQGPMDRFIPSNRNKILGPDGKPVKRPVTFTGANDDDDTVDFIEEDVNEAGKVPRLPTRRPFNKEQTTGSYYGNDNINDDRILTVGNQRIPGPSVPAQRPNQGYQIIKNADGSETLVPIEKNSQPGTPIDSRPDQINFTGEAPSNGQKQDQKYIGNRRPQLPSSDTSDTFTVNDGQRFKVDDGLKDRKRPTSTYQGYEYLVPVKTFEVGQNAKPKDGASTAKPFITQPDDTDFYYQRTGDSRYPSRPSNLNENGIQSTIRPIISNTRDDTPIRVFNQQSQPTSTLSPEFISTYKPASTEATFGNKIIPVTVSGVTSSIPAQFSPLPQTVYPSTTYRPTYNIIKGSQGENIVVDEFGRPAIKSTPSPFSPTQGTYSVAQRVPTIVDATGRPVPTQFTSLPRATAPSGQRFTPQRVDAYGRPIQQTLVDVNGKPVVTSTGQIDQTTGRPVYTIGPDNQISRVTSPGYKLDNYGRPVTTPDQNISILPGNVTPRPQQQLVTVDEYGRPVATGSSQVYENKPNQVKGEDFSGPKQQPKYDSKTGYYY